MLQFLRFSFTLTVLFFLIPADAQTLFYQDAFNGGVTAGGYAPDYSSGGTGSFTLQIPANSTIKKAWLMAGRHGLAANCGVKLNGISYTFMISNQVSTNFQSPLYGGTSGVHAIDVTADLDSSVNSYSLQVQNQAGPAKRYNDFYLVVAYENAAFDPVHVGIFVNEYDLTESVTWNLALPFALDTAHDAGIGLFTGYSCWNGDGEDVYVNGTLAGTFYGPESNSGSCGGPMAHFVFENGILTGLGDDDENAAILGGDVLVAANSYVNNGDTACKIKFDSQSGVADNALWAVVVVNGGGCPAVQAGPDTTICFGSSVPLYASGGTTFSWSPASGLSDANVSNPVAAPEASTLYYVTISDSSGCVSIDSVMVAYFPKPSAGPDIVICKGDSAQFTASGALTYSWDPVTFLSDPAVPDPVCFSPYDISYSCTMLDTNNCTTTDIAIADVESNVFPPSIVQAGNQLTCSPALSYQWKLNSVIIPGATNQSYTITQSGFYSVAVVDSATGCPTESALLYFDYVGLNDLSGGYFFLAGPNPASDFMTVTLYNASRDCDLKVVNALGQVVLQMNGLDGPDFRFNVEHFTAGMYYLVLSDRQLTQWMPFVKQ